ncbi:hypothetical protein K8I61_06355, partial [bacterium]|nr:hypothetical protein [bacterium]
DPQIYGFVVGETNTQTAAFFGVVHDGRVTRKTLPFAEDIRLNAIDYLRDDDWGMIVGQEHDANVGAAFELIGETAGAVTLPFLPDNWDLVDVAVVDVGKAFIVGNQTGPTGARGIIFEVAPGGVTPMTPPVLVEPWRLDSVSFFSTTKGWAVGFDDANNQTLILGYNGFAWTRFDTPAENFAQLTTVTAPSTFFAVTLGSILEKGATTTKGYSLVWDGLSWLEVFAFPGDGVQWWFSNIYALSDTDVRSFVIKSNHLEEWNFNGFSWTRKIHAASFASNSIISAVSFIDGDTALLASRQRTGSIGAVYTQVGSVWQAFDEHPTSMGNLHDTFAVGYR